ncbi:MAG: hypothetical protein IH940_09905 [Acidobacteria bacterium]|nr:hypothetical protein [Acidobacteriota bacterium]
MTFPNAFALGLVIALGLGVVACGGDSSGVAAGSNPVEFDAGLLDLDASVIGGSDYSLEQHANSDLVLWFWAPW